MNLFLNLQKYLRPPPLKPATHTCAVIIHSALVSANMQIFCKCFCPSSRKPFPEPDNLCNKFINKFKIILLLNHAKAFWVNSLR